MYVLDVHGPTRLVAAKLDSRYKFYLYSGKGKVVAINEKIRISFNGNIIGMFDPEHQEISPLKSMVRRVSAEKWNSQVTKFFKYEYNQNLNLDISSLDTNIIGIPKNGYGIWRLTGYYYEFPDGQGLTIYPVFMTRWLSREEILNTEPTQYWKKAGDEREIGEDHNKVVNQSDGIDEIRVSYSWV